MPAVPGDLVRHEGVEKVVVDVTDEAEPWAVLRNRDDLDGLNPTAAPVAGLEVVGHLGAVPGWVEDAPGVWRQA